MVFKRGNKRGQVTIFIIIAIIIVAAVGVFFIVRSQQQTAKVPASIQPAYQAFLSCLQDDALSGVSILESNGGYITLPKFEAGSSYMPFSSQLNAFGSPIPYWYYVSGNNIERQQVPTKSQMEQQLGSYIDGKIRNCVLNDYYQQGFHIDLGEPNTKVSIGTNQISIDLSMNMNINKESDSAVISDHKVTIASPLGDLYNSALKIYDYENKNLFLENYSIDALRTYAPVDGLEITCSPKIWDAEQVFSTLRQGIEANTLAMSTQGSNKYFTIKLPVSQQVRFLNSQYWPSSFEVNPSQGAALVANPVGNQPGLGVLGFCYVPYHFVYNVRYPVLVQLYEGNDIFQFPMAVIIQGNEPRQALAGNAELFQTSNICDFMNTSTEVNIFDSQSNPVDANISYQCANQVCNIGQTSNGVLQANFPQCVNGFISVTANGFKDNNFQYSTVQSGSANIILDRVYNLGVNLRLDGSSYNNKAVINFISNDSSSTIVYPDQKNVQLSEGNYNVEVYIYGQSNLNLGTGTYQQCVDTLSGISGLLGIKQKSCINVNVPSQIITSVLSGGGKMNYYMTEGQLQSSNTIDINAQSLPTPTTVTELENNYISFENRGLEINFR
ncbi:MAG TPA: hypothetical protein VMC80_00890 [Patescibacteria group bacterium]|nr:hypothetical protein [Patescibacteria group bacterium]